MAVARPSNHGRIAGNKHFANMILILVILAVAVVVKLAVKQVLSSMNFTNCIVSLQGIQIKNLLFKSPWFQKLYGQPLQLSDALVSDVDLSEQYHPAECDIDSHRALIIAAGSVTIGIFPRPRISISNVRIHLPASNAEIELEQRIIFPHGYPRYSSSVYYLLNAAIIAFGRFVTFEAKTVSLHIRNDGSGNSDVLTTDRISSSFNSLSFHELIFYRSGNHIYKDKSESELSIGNVILHLSRLQHHRNIDEYDYIKIPIFQPYRYEIAFKVYAEVENVSFDRIINVDSLLESMLAGNLKKILPKLSSLTDFIIILQI